MGFTHLVLRWTPLERVLNGIAAVAGITSLVYQLWAGNRTTASLVNLAVIVLLLTSFAAYAFIISRKERYADITAHIENVAERCRRARNRLGKNEEILREGSKIRDDLEVVMTDIATTFSMVTGTKCRAALKAFRPLPSGGGSGLRTPKDWYCTTLARDHTSAATCSNGDKRRAASQFDTLDKNPHLMSLFSDMIDGEDWEIFNNIPKMISDGRYASSSLLWEMNVSHTHSGGHHSHVLPYKSAITALVRSRGGEAIAFIGVDSAATSVFRIRSDGALLAALGSYIGPLLEDAFLALGESEYSDDFPPT